MFDFLLRDASKKQEVLAAGWVVPEAGRCVQCGICSYSCPIGIDVRAYAMQGRAVHEKHCLTCGECVLRCPRDVFHFETSWEEPVT